MLGFRTTIYYIVFMEIKLNWDGTISGCCADYNGTMLVGDLKDSSLYDIWHGEAIDYYRKKIANNEHSVLDPCYYCYL